MKSLAYVCACLILAASVPTLGGHDPEPKKEEAQKPDPKKVKELMRRKLDSSQKLLEALVMNDLDKAIQQADELMQIRKQAAWMVVKTQTYELWSEDFRQNAQDLVKAAKEKNLEGAKLSYLGMTLSCFHCHSYVRDLGMIRFDEDSNP